MHELPARARWNRWIPVAAGIAMALADASELAAQDAAAPADAKTVAPSQWHDAAALGAELQALTSAHRDLSRVTSYGRSRAGRDLWCVEIGSIDAVDRARLPALLVVAGLDGQHLVGTEIVVDHVRRLLDDYAKDAAVTRLLDEHVVYLIPRANPDGAEAWFAQVKREVRGNLRPLDEDRDGQVDEDGPEDLDHDGFITQMRYRDPAGTMIEDPADVRVMRAADPLKGEKGLYKVTTEGIDRDGDGEYAEDGAGDVVPARNFPQRWLEHDPGAGHYPMEEPETLALGQFLFERPAIAIAIVYGLNDNVAVDAKNDPSRDEGQSVGFGGQSFRFFRSMPAGIVKEDQPLYGELATRYREATGVTSKALLEADDGAFWAFSYFQFGIPTLAMHAWSPPLDVKPPEPQKPAGGEKTEGEKKPVDVNAAETAVPGDAGPTPTTAAAPVNAATGSSGEVPGGPPGGRPERGDKKEKAESDELKLLRWNDQKLGGAGFVPWTKVAHPTLGEVEVGGWKPYVRSNPPLEEVADLARRHSDFLIQLGGLFARVAIGDVKVENLGSGVFRVTANVVNEGWLPSVCGMAERNRRPKPTRLELDLGGAKLLQGEQRHILQRIEGSGGRREVKWLLQASSGSEVLLRLWSEVAGDAEFVVELH